MVVSIILYNLLFGSIYGWERFEQTAFRWEYDEELGMEVQIPYFDSRIEAQAGQIIELGGHYLPMELGDDYSIILSKLPYASCFFCGGGAGPESVVEVVFAKKHRKFKMDEIITVRGKLVLNVRDYDHMIFILKDAQELK